MSANTSPEVAGESGSSSEMVDPSQISPESGESIVSAIIWAWRADKFYGRSASEAMSRVGERLGRPFDDTNGEYVPSPAQREEAEQDVWHYAINQVGVSIEDMYRLQECAAQRMEQIDLTQELEDKGDN
jgi:hypothetical protein